VPVLQFLTSENEWMNCCRQDCNIEHLWDYVPNLLVKNMKLDLCVPTWWMVYFIWVVHELPWPHMLLGVSQTNSDKPLDTLHTFHTSNVVTKKACFQLLVPVVNTDLRYVSLQHKYWPFNGIFNVLFIILSEFPFYSFF
jgi:hypothetical protein